MREKNQWCVKGLNEGEVCKKNTLKKIKNKGVRGLKRKMRGYFILCVWGGVSFWFPLTLLSWAEGAFSQHNVDCSSASQEMPQLQITDQAKHVWRWALRGINSPPLTTTHPQCTDPSRNLHYWERKYYQLPTNKHLPISRAGIAFVSCFGKKQQKGGGRKR